MKTLLFLICLLPLELTAQTCQLHVLHDFLAAEGRPIGKLTLGTDGNVYGTTIADGSPGSSIVFRMTPDGR